MDINNTTGIQQVDGKYYYYDDKGNLKKGFTGIHNNQLLVFSSVDGHLESYSSDLDLKIGSYINVYDFSAHNEAYDSTEKSFTNVDGYITARSWYRPKDILKKGIYWSSSKSTDFRPILMTWKPDTNTLVNYLNYMKDNGYIKSTLDFTDTMNFSLLMEANNSIQRVIERKISRKGIKWLNELIEKFIISQPQWNSLSESVSNDHLQGGALLYKNSSLTPDSNSDFRLLNRTPTNQTGVQKYFTDKSLGGYELLLASDVDNSNPTVQAEQLNWIHFLLNFGSIVANDKDANFDGIRVDAVDNVDADLLQIASDYFKYAFGSGKNDYRTNSHLSILEDWSYNDPQYVNDFGNAQLSMDATTQTQLLFSLAKKSGERAPMKRFIEWYMVDRRDNGLNSKNQPNYSFFRAHDSEVQTIIANIIQDLHPGSSNGLIPTMDEIKEAFIVYNNDMNKIDKEYTQYNVPSAYAMLLTNKDTVPRVYYGDMYTDDGVFMGTKSPYYDYIDAMLRVRKQFVDGGQHVEVNADDVLTSVRFGAGASSASDISDSASETGVGIIVSNNKNLKATEDVTLHMGKSHANQEFVAVLHSGVEKLSNYLNATKAPRKVTDDNGDLIFSKEEIHGVSNVEVSGFLSVWIPSGVEVVDAPLTNISSKKIRDDEQFFRSNRGLDNNVIFEAFSNFQEIPTAHENYENVILPKKASLFREWGITSVQLPPQYRSSTDTTFLDSIIKNGYAFTDRYDLGFGKPTKYGTVSELVDTIKAFHEEGIQVMADFVPDQLYNLPSQEVVNVSRTNAMGVQNDDSEIDDILYVTNSRGGGVYQTKFGGKFLPMLKAKYPAIFERKQISTGLPIDDTSRLLEWSAKYLNGSAIQGHGFSSVLRDDATDKYFRVKGKSVAEFLPKQFTNEGDFEYAGLSIDDEGRVSYTSDNGYKAINSVVTIGEDKYYFDNDGYMATGLKKVDGKYYYFTSDGKAAKSQFVQDANDDIYYVGATGRAVANSYVHDYDYNYYYTNSDGKVYTDAKVVISGHTQYFNSTGVQVKGAWVNDAEGRHYFHSGDGNMAVEEYIENTDGSWSYYDVNGNAVKGFLTVNGNQQFFDDSYRQAKGAFVLNNEGMLNYFSSDLGNLVIAEFFESNGEWYYSNEEGTVLRGLSIVDVDNESRLYNFDYATGMIIRNEAIVYNGISYQTNGEGYAFKEPDAI